MKLPIIIETATSINNSSSILVGKKELILHQLNKLSLVENGDVYIVTGKNHKLIKEMCPEYKLIRNKCQTNASYSVGLAMSKLRTKRALIVLGNSYFNNATLNVEFGKKPFLFINKNQENSIGCTYDTHLEHMFYGLPNKWSGLFYVSSNVFNDFMTLCLAYKNKYLFEIINMLTSKHSIDIVFPNKSKAILIDEQCKIEPARKIK